MLIGWMRHDWGWTSCTVLTKRHGKLALWGALYVGEPTRLRGAVVVISGRT